MAGGKSVARQINALVTGGSKNFLNSGELNSQTDCNRRKVIKDSRMYPCTHIVNECPTSPLKSIVKIVFFVKVVHPLPLGFKPHVPLIFLPKTIYHGCLGQSSIRLLK